MEDKTKLIERNQANPKKKRFVLKNLTQKQRNMLLTGGAALGGAGMASLLASSFSFASKDDVNSNVDPNVALNQDIDGDGILNDVDDDIDGDGILNQSDTDMDGDGIENTKDDDVDGDGILNEDDTHTPDYEEDLPAVVIYTEAPFSELELDEMPFGEAFAAARHDIGAGGFFEWHGKVYNTYYKEEWDSLSPEEQNDFMHSVVENSNFHEAEELDPTDIVDIVDATDEDDDIIEEHDDLVDDIHDHDDDGSDDIEDELVIEDIEHDDIDHDDTDDGFDSDFDSDMTDDFIDDIADA